MALAFLAGASSHSALYLRTIAKVKAAQTRSCAHRDAATRRGARHAAAAGLSCSFSRHRSSLRSLLGHWRRYGIISASTLTSMLWRWCCSRRCSLVSSTDIGMRIPCLWIVGCHCCLACSHITRSISGAALRGAGTMPSAITDSSASFTAAGLLYMKL